MTKTPLCPPTKGTRPEAATPVDRVTCCESATTLKPLRGTLLRSSRRCPERLRLRWPSSVCCSWLLYRQPGSWSRSGGSEVHVRHGAVLGQGPLLASHHF